MMEKKKKFHYITVFVITIYLMILLICVVYPIVHILLTDRPVDVKMIKESYKENQILFKKSIHEFSNLKESVIIKKEEKQPIHIIDRNHSNENVNEDKKIYEESLQRYKSSIELMKKLNLQEIYYMHKHVSYVYNYYHFTSQTIVYISDMKSYIMEGHTYAMLKKEELGDGWWYMEYDMSH